MVALIRHGTYVLFETKLHTRILLLNETDYYAWILVKNIGEILIKTTKKINGRKILARGVFRLYNVVDEPLLTDLTHLELLVGEGSWQGYLLPTGLPTKQQNKNIIIPTSEIITKSISLDTF